MQCIYNKNGKAVAWMEDDTIYSIKGAYIAFIDDGNVFSFEENYLGTFENKLFRALDGDIVAFVKGAKEANLQFPKKLEIAIEPIEDIGPIPPIPGIPRLPDPPMSRWGVSWSDFIQGKSTRWMDM